MFKRNTAVLGFPIGHFIQTADGAAKTTGTPACTRLLDGTPGTLTNAASYDATAGVWKIDLAAGDMDADMVGVSFALADCIPISYAIRTSTSLVSDVETDTVDIQSRIPAALIGGRMDATVGVMQNNVLTAAALATDAVTEIAAAVSTAGSGAISYTVTVNDESAQPLDGVEVWVTSDSAGTTVVAGTLTTNAAGQVTFMLDAGTYYLWRQLSRYNFSNPLTITVA